MKNTGWKIKVIFMCDNMEMREMMEKTLDELILPRNLGVSAYELFKSAIIEPKMARCDCKNTLASSIYITAVKSGHKVTKTQVAKTVGIPISTISVMTKNIAQNVDIDGVLGCK